MKVIHGFYFVERLNSFSNFSEMTLRESEGKLVAPKFCMLFFLHFLFILLFLFLMKPEIIVDTWQRHEVGTNIKGRY